MKKLVVAGLVMALGLAPALRWLRRVGAARPEAARLEVVRLEAAPRGLARPGVTRERRADAGRSSLRFQVASEAVLEGLPRASR